MWIPINIKVILLLEIVDNKRLVVEILLVVHVDVGQPIANFADNKDIMLHLVQVLQLMPNVLLQSMQIVAHAFHNQCNVTTNSPDWYVDSGASTHMTASLDGLNTKATYNGTDSVTIANGKTLPISHISTSSITNLPLLDVLVVPH